MFFCGGEVFSPGQENPAPTVKIYFFMTLHIAFTQVSTPKQLQLFYNS